MEFEEMKCRCQDCVCLVEGEDGAWICDETGRRCIDTDRCPEFISPAEVTGFFSCYEEEKDSAPFDA